MFDALQESLGAAFKTLRGQGKLTESSMRDGLKLVEKALLEADVSYDVVGAFMKRVSEQSLGEKVLSSLRPNEQVMGIIYQELVDLMGPVDHSLHLKGKGEVTVLMMCGLQGSGKTTTCGKLGKMLKENGRRPLLVAADLQRPAAIDQLHVLGEQIGIPVYSDRTTQDPVKVTANAVEQAKKLDADVVILDTAGRLHIDDELMEQLKRIDQRCHPDQVYLVVDGMTGQDAVNSAKAFNDALELDGVIMTKLDGDARGGAAISVKEVTGVPLKFMGTGEHLENLEPFHPERMAGRILGQGDIMSLVEKAQQEFDEDDARKLEEQLARGEFTLDDFLKQMQQIKRLGPLKKVLGMIPGMSSMLGQLDDMDAEGDLRRLQGIIHSMTMAERRKPKVIDQSRRRRIAAGAGVEPSAVSDLVKQFDTIAPIMTMMAGKGVGDRMKMMREVQAQMASGGGGLMGKKKQSTGKRLSTKDKAQALKERQKRLKQLKKGKKK
jgi:signal recognition particle subunit SRP54